MAAFSHAASDPGPRHGDGHEHHHHVTPQRQLITTFLMLLALMILTVTVAKIPHEGVFAILGNTAFANAIALGIAFAKAGMVIQIFMGVRFTTNLVKFYAYGGFLWFMLVGIILIDYFSRPLEPVQGWEKAPSTALPRDVNHLDGTDRSYKPFRAASEGKEAH